MWSNLGSLYVERMIEAGSRDDEQSEKDFRRYAEGAAKYCSLAYGLVQQSQVLQTLSKMEALQPESRRVLESILSMLFKLGDVYRFKFSQISLTKYRIAIHDFEKSTEYYREFLRIYRENPHIELPAEVGEKIEELIKLTTVLPD